MEVEVISELQVDNSRGTKMFINIDLTMSHLPCNYFSVDAMGTVLLYCLVTFFISLVFFKFKSFN